MKFSIAHFMRLQSGPHPSHPLYPPPMATKIKQEGRLAKVRGRGHIAHHDRDEAREEFRRRAPRGCEALLPQPCSGPHFGLC